MWEWMYPVYDADIYTHLERTKASLLWKKVFWWDKSISSYGRECNSPRTVSIYCRIITFLYNNKKDYCTRNDKIPNCKLQSQISLTLWPVEWAAGVTDGHEDEAWVLGNSFVLYCTSYLGYLLQIIKIKSHHY